MHYMHTAMNTQYTHTPRLPDTLLNSHVKHEFASTYYMAVFICQSEGREV